MEKDGKRDFDAEAASWDEEPRRLQLARDVAETIRRELPFSSRMVALDYGCGSGLLTLGLQPYLRRITGADSSRGMLEVLNRKIATGGLGNVDTLYLDLERQSLDASYDLIVSSMTMHHVQDVAALVGSLVENLNPGGWLALADLESEDGSFHGDPAGIFHHGFDRDFFLSIFQDNSLTERRVVPAASMEKTDQAGERRSYPVLLWLARKG